LRLCFSDSRGTPESLLSDNAKEFQDHTVLDFLRSNNVIIKNAIPYHPQSQGAVESFNGTYKR